MSEIRRSAVLDTNKMPGGVARINGWVTYRVDGSRQCESKVLIYPDDLRNDQTGLSVLSPLGAAVLGLSIGHRMKFFSIEGGLHSVVVEDVAPREKHLLFPLEPRNKGHHLCTDSRGPDDDGPEAV
jgi:regulator of nucleoside diphosphate kinase